MERAHVAPLRGEEPSDGLPGAANDARIPAGAARYGRTGGRTGSGVRTRTFPALAGIAAALLLLAVGGCEASKSERAHVVFHDDFDTENGLVSRANYTGLRQWEIVTGSVDLAGTYPFDLLPPGNGMYLDLDGASGKAAVLRSRRALVLEPGEYTLSYRLAGSQRVSDPNTVHVSLGGVFRDSATLPQYAPMRAFVRRFVVRRRTVARLEFAHEGGDNFGVLLDDVTLTRR
ncbi:MAG: hypothetical protein JWM27_3048 [Gemmatimonadetes bacterium]|nr:hypothetical protein [Gemmatimonadota bacterium]